MNFQCASCQQLSPLTAFRVVGGALVARCTFCGAETQTQSGSDSSVPTASERAPATEPAPVQAAVPVGTPAWEAPLAFCPKCISPRAVDALLCDRCGLTFDNFTIEDHRPSDEIDAAWAKLTERWAERAAHEAFMVHAAAKGELVAAARLYRIRLARMPGDEMATLGCREVQARAAAFTLAPTSVVDLKQSLRPWRNVLIACFVVGLLWLVGMMLRMVFARS